MTVVTNEKKFDRFWTVTAGSLSLLALVFTIIALRTSSWTINEYSSDGEVQWHGLFYTCNRMKCTLEYDNNFWVIFLTILSALLLLLATIMIFLMGVHSFPRRHFYITPLIEFFGVLLLLVSLVLYARQSLINGISARLIITAIVLGYTSLAIVVFVAGRYSIFYKKNPADFHYSKTEKNEAVKRVEEEQAMERGEN
ncbi:unnamed protein product [Adineta steineri]|uniref:Uncharacterized protein n=1 Tax=Adineta steineri TaxID=433720 RepID=A0A814Z9Z7_9BILA|nr:unnamed protein product [Adineta steineri]CAF3587931.1 unnamed protein product [Adineta steineri]